MSTRRHNLTIREGATFSWVYTWLESGVAVDLTGYTGEFKIAGWGEGSVALGGDAGTVTLSLTPAQTTDLADGGLTGFGVFADFVWSKGRGLTVDDRLKPEPIERAYSVYVTSGAGVVTQVLEGIATIYRDVDV